MNQNSDLLKVVPLYNSEDPREGYGVVATVDIPQGTKLFDYAGEELTTAQHKERYADCPGIYVLQLSPEKYIDACQLEGPDFETNQSRFINGATPSEVANVESWSDDITVAILTSKPIKRGEELLMDYGAGYVFKGPLVKKPQAGSAAGDAARADFGQATSAAGELRRGPTPDRRRRARRPQNRPLHPGH